MKFSCVILICPLLIASAMAAIRVMTFDSCNPDEWIMTNTTISWVNHTKTIACNLTYKKLIENTVKVCTENLETPYMIEHNNTVYRIQIQRDNCKMFTCTGQPIVSINNVDCNAQNLSQPDMNVCKISNELGNLEREKQLLKSRYGSRNANILFKLVFCLNLSNMDMSWDDTELNNL